MSKPLTGANSIFYQDMTSPRKDSSIELSDGRDLAYAEYGDPDGVPMMLFHGLPGSRLAWGFLPGNPFPSGMRIIAPDRPGYGRSSPNPGRSLLDWTEDVKALVERLRIDRFHVVGVSGGGPGALACASALPDLIPCVGVVAGAAPTNAPRVFDGMSSVNKFFMRLAASAPAISALNTRFIAWVVRRNPGRYIEMMQRKVHEVDRAILADSNIRDMLVEDFAEALRPGGQGMVDDMATNHGQPWGFRLNDIRTKVVFWYGALDHSVSPAMGRYLADQVPNSDFHLVEEAGHLWPLVHLIEILEDVVHSGRSENRV
ncbi:alpha/beta hydrolase [uncultured Ruegeria sp.]|uniref:alpha/beta fold hydrolase n=1 Tax=uncultured Ruegeria sp. TaxID=259304 RepID=UPI0026263805|nr:alpha/beta hydrolase [uncultured Ruegeria sp.]